MPSGSATSYTSLDPLAAPAVSEADPPAHHPHQVAESFFSSSPLGNLLGPGYGMFAGPDGGDAALAGRYGGWWPADRVQLPNHAPLGFLTEYQYRACVSWSRWLNERNMLAIGFREHVAAFVGPMQVQFVRRDMDGPGEAAPAPAEGDRLLAAVTRVWEEWCEAADWGRGEQDREDECRQRIMRDGEVNLRLGAGGRRRDFLPWCRFVEPEQIRRPDGNTRTRGDWQWGVCTDPDDAETHLAYWLADPDSGGATGEEVSADDIVRAKANVDRTVKRGLPDFFPVEEHLVRVLGILANVGATAQEQAGVAWIEQYATATPDQVQRMIEQGPGAFGPRPSPGAARSDPRFIKKTYGSTRVIHADQNRQFAPGPTSEGVPSYAQAVEITLRPIGFRWGVPDWFSGGGESSFAAALVTGSPFVRLTETRQEKVKGFTKNLAMRVIELAEESGRLPAGTSRAVKPVVTAKPVVIADEQKQASVTDMELRNKLIDPQEAIKKRGRDPKVVIANWKAWAKEFPEAGGAPPGSAPPGTPPGTDPEPAPPGSAGGDGGQPDELGDLFGDDEVREGAGLVEREVTVHRGGKTFTQHRKVRAGDDEPAQTTAAAGGLFDHIYGPGGPQPVAAHTHPVARDYSASAKSVSSRQPSKQLKAAMGYKDVARRRRIIKAVRNEGELADAIGGYNLPDSEPADVVHILDAVGKPIRDRMVVKHVLAMREHVVKELRRRNLDPDRRRVLEHVLAQQQVHFFEVKTLLTSPKGTVHISAKAMKRKVRWADRYHASFHQVAFDDRRGSKHSGHRVHVVVNGLGGTVHLKDMTRAASAAAVLDHAYGKAGGP